MSCKSREAVLGKYGVEERLRSAVAAAKAGSSQGLLRPRVRQLRLLQQPG